MLIVDILFLKHNKFFHRGGERTSCGLRNGTCVVDEIALHFLW